MTVKQLKEQLIGVPDEAVILIPGSDHSYNKASVESTTARFYRMDGFYCEDCGEENDPGSIQVAALVFS